MRVFWWVMVALQAAAARTADPRFISYQDLMETGSEYIEPGVTSYSQLLLDISRNQLFVGARDLVARLTLDTLEAREKAVWVAPGDKVEMCINKGQPEADCHNYVKVLLTNGLRLLTCGTNAFSPQCAWRELEGVRRVTEWVRGVGKCPYSPHSNITALLTSEGHYIAGSPMDFSGSDAAITRSEPYLRTKQYNSKLLNEPQFIGSFETEQFVYFVFREIAVEFINCGKIVYSRIARVCKNDTGGKVMLRDNWTTFVKARLNCSLPGEFPFYYDNAQGMAHLPQHGLLYVTFTTPPNSIAGSAICAFNTSSIAAAFNGAFKHQASVSSTWERHNSDHSMRHCSSGPYNQVESSQYQLMDSAVQPTTLSPLYHSELETLTHIAVDIVPTKLHRAVDILYVATVEGLVKKLTVVGRTGRSCLLEIWQPSATPTTIHTLKFTLDSLYIGMETSVVRIARHHCSRHTSRGSCINSMDPHCGWDDHTESCITPVDPLASHFHQDATQCPILHLPVDGGWSAWSTWAPCSNGAEGGCICSTRRCDNPAPERGGAPCSGTSVRVTNCTIHGSWSPWSGWSACSQTCGMAVKTRRRICGNPAPQHGGRVCVGLDRNEMYCHSNPPCPQTVLREGTWSNWGPWGKCSAKCGDGFRVRSRSCSVYTDCLGCSLEYQNCNEGACVESRRLSGWSSWMGSGNGTERRVRFSCRAPSPDPSLIKVTLYKTDERSCTQDGVCVRSERGEGWSEWSAWSPCSADCGEGLQQRVRSCEGEDCPGPHSLSRPCHSRPCHGKWACWSDWSPCSASCGTGFRERKRECIGSQDCQGQSTQIQSCHQNLCTGNDGWDTWSGWGPCVGDEQMRSRLCLASAPGPELCHGADRETRLCPQQEELLSEAESCWGWMGVLWGCIIGLTVGAVAGWGGAVWKQRSTPSLPSSPHYISKQNPYVSVPLREIKRNSQPNTADLDHDKFF